MDDMRDIYKDIGYFEAQLESGALRREKSLEKLKNPDITDQAKQNRTHILFDIQLARGLTLYNMGRPLDEVVAEINKAWPLLNDSLEFSLSSRLKRHEKSQLVPRSKVEYFPLLVLSDPPHDVAHRLFDFCKTILNYEINVGKTREIDVTYDSFLEKFADYFNYKSENVHPDTLWPRIYGKLYECFSQDAEIRSEILKNYVDKWAKLGQEGEHFYLRNEHSMKTNQEFRGYWCFLGAAVAKILKIDDSALKGHPHYPYDLVHYRSGGK